MESKIELKITGKAEMGITGELKVKTNGFAGGANIRDTISRFSRLVCVIRPRDCQS